MKKLVNHVRYQISMVVTGTLVLGLFDATAPAFSILADTELHQFIPCMYQIINCEALRTVLFL